MMTASITALISFANQNTNCASKHVNYLKTTLKYDDLIAVELGEDLRIKLK